MTSQETVRQARKAFASLSYESRMKRVKDLFNTATVLFRNLPTSDGLSMLTLCGEALKQMYNSKYEWVQDAIETLHKAADAVADVLVKRGSKPESMTKVVTEDEEGTFLVEEDT